MKKILMVNTTVSRGGAAGVMQTIASYLPKSRYKVDFHVARSSRLWRFIITALSATDIVWGRSLVKTQSYQNADIIHLHNLHGSYFPLKELRQITKDKQVIWTLHDLWALQAKSPVNEEFKLWSYPHMIWNNAAKLLRTKKHIYRRSNLILIVPSKWLQKKVKRSHLAHCRVVYIPHGINTSLFKPADQVVMRKHLGLPINQKILLFVASGGEHNPYKGWRYLKEAMKSYPHYLCLCVGGDKKRRVGNILYMPELSDTELAHYYQASDYFIAPSLYESFGLTVIEALASGKPIIAFRSDAIPEHIRQYHNGYLAPEKSSRALIKAIAWMDQRTKSELRAMQQLNRQKAVQNYSTTRMVRGYRAIYEQGKAKSRSK